MDRSFLNKENLTFRDGYESRSWAGDYTFSEYNLEWNPYPKGSFGHIDWGRGALSYQLGRHVTRKEYKELMNEQS